MRPVVVAQSSASGGAESYLRRLYGNWSEASLADPVLLGCIPGWEMPALDVGLGPKWGRRTVLSGFARLPGERRRVVSSAATIEVDYFHLQFKREQIGLTRALARSFGPVLWTEHGRMPGGVVGEPLRALYARAARHAKAVVAVSEMVARDVRELVSDRVPVFVIENAVDTRAMVPPSPAERLASREWLHLVSAPMVLWAAQMHAGKLPLLAAEAANLFNGEKIFCGRGPLEGRLRESLVSGRVFSDVSDVRPFYRAADVFLFTSSGKGEGLPMTILEASAHGLPTVTNIGSGMGDLVEAAGGVVANDNASSIALALCQVVEEREWRGAIARRWVEDGYDLGQWSRRHLQIVREHVLGPDD